MTSMWICCFTRILPSVRRCKPATASASIKTVHPHITTNDSPSHRYASALTEKIVGVLPRMKCPFLIEPHQIQGLDFINIFPVVQWLVKRSVENRSKKADTLRKLAATQFQNHGTLESDRELQRLRAKQLANLQAIESKYLPKRGFKLRKAAGGGWIPVRPKDVADQETPDGALEDVLEADVDEEEGEEDVSVSTEQEV